VHDYLLYEMAKIRIDELRAEASRARVAQGSWRHYLGILGLSGVRRAEGGSFSRGMVEEGCCA
jgi:hypothetical protein